MADVDLYSLFFLTIVFAATELFPDFEEPFFDLLFNARSQLLLIIVEL